MHQVEADREDGYELRSTDIWVVWDYLFFCANQPMCQEMQVEMSVMLIIEGSAVPWFLQTLIITTTGPGDWCPLTERTMLYIRIMYIAQRSTPSCQDEPSFIILSRFYRYSARSKPVESSRGLLEDANDGQANKPSITEFGLA